MKQPRPAPRRAEGASASGDCRCLCGSLLARVVAGRVELKCRRCKRTLLVPLEWESARPLPPRGTRAATPARRAG